MRRVGLGGCAVWRVLGRLGGRLIVREEEGLRVRFELGELAVSINPSSATYESVIPFHISGGT